MDEPNINELNMNEPDINEPNINEPDINEPNLNETNLNKPDTNENNTLQSSNHYKALIKHDKNEVLLPEKIAEEIFNKISLVGSDEYFENNSDGINFKSTIVLDDFKDEKNTPQEISKKIANLIGDSDGYYYIYFNYYDSKKMMNRESIECFDYNGTLRISINMITNNAYVYLKYEILHQ
ncbi:2310_t:CDS:2 [Racocetra fulgida]|uniref:2310_t:CDS:1 n=1 Tax=Racocetra fulgida TaxID=60492 RepID=A0A9N9END0_9GLOM|nr:2310_t:CDS:2 [Racocetra fulgida]